MNQSIERFNSVGKGIDKLEAITDIQAEAIRMMYYCKGDDAICKTLEITQGTLDNWRRTQAFLSAHSVMVRAQAAYDSGPIIEALREAALSGNIKAIDTWLKLAELLMSKSQLQIESKSLVMHGDVSQLKNVHPDDYVRECAGNVYRMGMDLDIAIEHFREVYDELSVIELEAE